MNEVDRASPNVKMYLLRVIFEAGCNEDAAHLIKTLCNEDFTFLTDSRSLLISVWQAVLTPLRIAIMNVKESPGPHSSVVLRTLEELLKDRISEFIELLTQRILPKATSEEDVAIYTLTLADFQRYQLETIEREGIPALANESRQNYVRAIEMLKALSQSRLDTVMLANVNYAILLADYLLQRKKAIELLTGHHHTLTVSMDKYSDELRAQLKDVVALMTENITRWKTMETQ
jgi:hypothetical protein